MTFTDVDIQESYVGTEPVSLAEAQSQCRVDFTDDDTYITTLISAARQSIENFCHVSLVPKTVTLTLEAVNIPKTNYSQPFQTRPNFNEFELPYGPTTEVDSVTSIDSDGTTVLVCDVNKDYFLTGIRFLKIKILNNFTNNILVYKTGYNPVPQALKLAILNEIAFRYEHRGDESSLARGGTTGLPGTVEVGLCLASQVLATPYIRLTSL